MDTIFPYCCKLLGEGQGVRQWGRGGGGEGEVEDGRGGRERGRGGRGVTANGKGAKSVCRSALPPPLSRGGGVSSQLKKWPFLVYQSTQLLLKGETAGLHLLI